VPQGLPDPRRHPGDADQRGAALDTGNITAVILAGGQGTRLRPLTNSRPKPVVPLLNIPFLAYQLALLRRHGVERVVLSCSYLVDEIRRTMTDGSRWGVRLDYAVEAEPLGTAGGVRNAADLLGDAVDGLVVVLNGDILTDLDLGAMLRFHAARGSRATIYLTRVEDPAPYGLVELGHDGRVRRFVEKPGPAERTANTINAGIYVLDGALLDRIPPARVTSIEREFFPSLLADGIPCFGWISDSYWIDIGSPAKYRQAHLDLLDGRVATDVGPAGAGGDRRSIAADASVGDRVSTSAPVVVGAGCRLDNDCRVGPRAVLGPGCVVGPDATVEGAVLWERVSVGADAVLRDCIVGADARIGPHAHVGAGVVLEDGAVVASPARIAP
jgi:mannose-1-phosphate guanylyltransferase